MSDAQVPPPHQGKKIDLKSDGFEPSPKISPENTGTAAPASAETRYTALTKHLRDGVVVYRAVDDGDDFVIMEFNPAAAAIEGCNSGDILGRRVTEVFPGVSQFGLLAVLQRVWRTGKTEHLPMRHYRDNRINGWRDNLVYRLPGGEVVALYRDETARKQSEEALHQSNQTLQAAQEMARLGHWQYNAATGAIEWSSQMFTLLDLAPDQGVPPPKDQNKLVHPDDRHLVTQAVRRALMDGQGSDIVFRINGKDQNTRWLCAQYHPQTNAEGDITGLSGIILDITEIKEAELAKVALESQLRRAQKMEAISTITGGIAHDFNNILGIILGNAELARDGVATDSDESKNISEIIQATLRAKEIIRQLLSFNRKDPGNLTTVDLVALVKDSLRLIRAVMPSNIAIHHDLPQTQEIIRADAGQIHQVLLNLCTNAMHAMEPDGGTLEVAVTQARFNSSLPPKIRDAADDYACLSIRDTGQGIDPESMERIFDPYFTTMEVGKGSGLGLAVVHGIIQKHGAAIMVESRKGRGSRFDVYFPRIETQPAQIESDVDERPAVAGTEAILFVDDEPSLVSTTQALLQRMGYRVVTAEDGNQALEVFQRAPQAFDLVISDMSMPGLSGDHLAEKLKTIRPDLPILLCTGYSDRMDPAIASSIGVRFAEKPLNRNQLGRIVRDILDSKNNPA